MSESSGDLRALVEQVAKSLVDAPDEVSVTVAGSDRDPVLELRVSPADLGKVIGKQGRVARAMRGLVGAASSKSDRRVTLEIIE
jgi:predicted RNA-binding protein YlqC (UPF0109 family)